MLKPKKYFKYACYRCIATFVVTVNTRREDYPVPETRCTRCAQPTAYLGEISRSEYREWRVGTIRVYDSKVDGSVPKVPFTTF